MIVCHVDLVVLGDPFSMSNGLAAFLISTQKRRVNWFLSNVVAFSKK